MRNAARSWRRGLKRRCGERQMERSPSRPEPGRFEERSNSPRTLEVARLLRHDGFEPQPRVIGSPVAVLVAERPAKKIDGLVKRRIAFGSGKLRQDRTGKRSQPPGHA